MRWFQSTVEDLAVEGEANMIFLRHEGLPLILHNGFGTIALGIHYEKQLCGKVLRIAQQHGVIPSDQFQCVLSGNEEGTLLLEHIFLLFHLQLCGAGMGVINPKANLAPNVLLCDLVKKVLVIQCVKIERTDTVTAVQRGVVSPQQLGEFADIVGCFLERQLDCPLDILRDTRFLPSLCPAQIPASS